MVDGHVSTHQGDLCLMEFFSEQLLLGLFLEFQRLEFGLIVFLQVSEEMIEFSMRRFIGSDHFDYIPQGSAVRQ